jgi:hypothetical protein
MTKQLEEIKTDLRGLDKQLKKLSERVQHIGTHVDFMKNRIGAEVDAEDSTKEEMISPSKSSFRIDIYPHQGHYQGKIEHVLSKEKVPFSDLDGNAIVNFMSKHLPQGEIKRSHQETKPETVKEAKKPTRKNGEATGQTPLLSGEPQITRIELVQPTSGKPTKSLSADQSFEVRVSVAAGETAVKAVSALEYQISIYAHLLGGKSRTLIGVGSGKAVPAEESSINIKCTGVLPGSYRLVGLMTVSGKTSTDAPCSIFNGDLILVY